MNKHDNIHVLKIGVFVEIGDDDIDTYIVQVLYTRGKSGRVQTHNEKIEGGFTQAIQYANHWLKIARPEYRIPF